MAKAPKATDLDAWLENGSQLYDQAKIEYETDLAALLEQQRAVNDKLAKLNTLGKAIGKPPITPGTAQVAKPAPAARTASNRPPIVGKTAARRQARPLPADDTRSMDTLAQLEAQLLRGEG